MHAIHLLAIWVHLLAAIVWIGGMAFLGVVLVPVLRAHVSGAQRAELFRHTGRRFRSVGWLCLVTLVATGYVNLGRWGVDAGRLLGAEFWRTPFGGLLAMKLGLVLLVLVMSAGHDFMIGPRASQWLREAPDAPDAQRLRRVASIMGRVNLACGIAIVAVGVLLVRGCPA